MQYSVFWCYWHRYHTLETPTKFFFPLPLFLLFVPHVSPFAIHVHTYYAYIHKPQNIPFSSRAFFSSLLLRFFFCSLLSSLLICVYDNLHPLKMIAFTFSPMSPPPPPLQYEDLLHPKKEDQDRKYKKKRLVQSPNSVFMDVKVRRGIVVIFFFLFSLFADFVLLQKCPNCYAITTVFSNAQNVVVCAGCNTILSQPTGGKCKLTEGCSFRVKQGI